MIPGVTQTRPLFVSLGMRIALLAVLTGAALCASPVTYLFHFQAEGQPTPTGGFTYDSATGQFSNFTVTLGGSTVDYTAVANSIGGNQVLPFELGFLAQNLIDGFGPLGPDYSHWYAGPLGFYGFEWRTPNPGDFLYVDFAINAPGDPISAAPGAYAGSWSTSIVENPEPATMGPVALALLAFAWRRRKT